MARIRAAAVIALGLLRAQDPSKIPSTLKFEVASLKLSKGNPNGPAGIRPAQGGQRYVAVAVPLRLMLMVAYRLKPEQVVGGPSWLDTDRFDMEAKAERPSSADELHVMLANLLADRFHLEFHRSAKEMPVYVLTVDKGGPKMKPHEAQNSGEPWIDQAIQGVVKVSMHATYAPMDYFAWRLGQLLDRPVIDRTNLKGGYDFDFSYTRELPPNIPEGALVNGNPIDTSGSTIFDALRQQLGLRLDKDKGPVETIVIDRVEKLVEN